MDYDGFLEELHDPNRRTNAKMISKQSVYLNADRSKAVPEGHQDARFLLVREGHDIEQSEIEKYDGAAGLIGAKAKGPSVDESRPAASGAGNIPQKAKRSPRAKAKQ
jgi:hypothetical protein